MNNYGCTLSESREEYINFRCAKILIFQKSEGRDVEKRNKIFINCLRKRLFIFSYVICQTYACLNVLLIQSSISRHKNYVNFEEFAFLNSFVYFKTTFFFQNPKM